jgi:transcriptional regulator with XRE-family HTH domain
MELKEFSTLRELRAEHRLTQAQLAARLGMNQAALSRLEGRMDVSVSMLRSFIEALGGKIEITARFPGTTVTLSGFTVSDTLEDLRSLVNNRCRIHPMPEERAADEFWVRTVDESLVSLEKLSNQQLLEIPTRRVLEVLPKTSSAPPTIALRGSLRWSANEKLWRMSL